MDGIDEVIAKVVNKFNINLFVKSIFENYSGNFEKAKILITCRDYFWDETAQPYPIHTISLNPFNKELAKNYFRYYFEEESKLKKAMSLADDFALKNDNNTYIPYILDMIKDDLLGASSSRKIDSKILQVNDDINDYLVGKVCEREIKKLDNVSIDRQIIVFIHMAINYNGVVHEEHFGKLELFLKEEFTERQAEKFKGHSLLVFNKNNKILSFRYDFFNEYFKNIELSRFLKKCDFSQINIDIIDIITQQISYDNSFTKNIKKRLDSNDYSNLKVSIWEFLLDIDKLEYLNIDKKNQLNSSLFTILLVLGSVNNTEERTSLLKEIYEHEKGVIENLCIMNLHTSSGKLLFDFRGLKFRNCIFENYEHFSICEYNSDTHFSQTKFIAPLHREGITPKITETNIDKYSCDIAGIIDVINEIEQLHKDEESILRRNLKKVFKFFWQSSSFKQKLASEAKKKIGRFSGILDVLIKNKVILKTTVTTRQKREDKAYLVNPEYSNLRKIMEENETCLEFERVVRLFKKNP